MLHDRTDTGLVPMLVSRGACLDGEIGRFSPTEIAKRPGPVMGGAAPWRGNPDRVPDAIRCGARPGGAGRARAAGAPPCVPTASARDRRGRPPTSAANRFISGEYRVPDSVLTWAFAPPGAAAAGGPAPEWAAAAGGGTGRNPRHGPARGESPMNAKHSRDVCRRGRGGLPESAADLAFCRARAHVSRSGPARARSPAPRAIHSSQMADSPHVSNPASDTGIVRPAPRGYGKVAVRQPRRVRVVRYTESRSFFFTD